MSLFEDLKVRSGSQCELCSTPDQLNIYEVPPFTNGAIDSSILACATCIGQINNPQTLDPNHWRCLNDSMWSEHPAVKVVAWRMLNRLKGEGWPQELLDMVYLEPEVLKWAEATGESQDQADQIVHRDVNGVVLQPGDDVVLIKDLKVKGSSMVAKQGAAVRRISLDRENAEYIEGKVDGQQIVIITKYVKKV